MGNYWLDVENSSLKQIQSAKPTIVSRKIHFSVSKSSGRLFEVDAELISGPFGDLPSTWHTPIVIELRFEVFKPEPKTITSWMYNKDETGNAIIWLESSPTKQDEIWTLEGVLPKQIVWDIPVSEKWEATAQIQLEYSGLRQKNIHTGLVHFLSKGLGTART